MAYISKQSYQVCFLTLGMYACSVGSSAHEHEASSSSEVVSHLIYEGTDIREFALEIVQQSYECGLRSASSSSNATISLVHATNWTSQKAMHVDLVQDEVGFELSVTGDLFSASNTDSSFTRVQGATVHEMNVYRALLEEPPHAQPMCSECSEAAFAGQRGTINFKLTPQILGTKESATLDFTFATAVQGTTIEEPCALFVLRLRPSSPIQLNVSYPNQSKPTSGVASDQPSASSAEDGTWLLQEEEEPTGCATAMQNTLVETLESITSLNNTECQSDVQELWRGARYVIADLETPVSQVCWKRELAEQQGVATCTFDYCWITYSLCPADVLACGATPQVYSAACEP